MEVFSAAGAKCPVQGFGVQALVQVCLAMRVRVNTASGSIIGV